MAKSARCGYSDGMSITEGSTQQTPGWTANDQTFGARLALIRQRMGWGNIAKAAKECGVPVDSWRNWEVDGVEPRRLNTIAMAIATRTGCDYIWLCHGPGWVGSPRPTTGFATGARVLATIGEDPISRGRTGTHSGPTTRPVRQTRPTRRMTSRPLTTVAN